MIRRSFLLLLSFIFFLPVVALAQKTPGSTARNAKFLASFHEVTARPSQSTVVIRCAGKNVALGTIVESNGLILTKASELAGEVKVRFKDGKELDAKILAVHEAHDLALLKVEAVNLTPIQWRPSKEVPVGYWAVSVGPEADPVALGVVSVAMRNVPKGGGGPVGPPSGGAYLGIQLVPESEEARIADVIPGGGAAKAGLKKDDVILAIAGKAIAGADAVRATLSKFKPGDVVKVKVKRGDEELELEAKLGKAPTNRGDFQNNLGSKLSARRTGFPTILQHDSVVKPEECGGPLVDLEGKCIGINIARAGRTESYAIPTEVLLPLLEEMKQGRHPPKKGKG